MHFDNPPIQEALISIKLNLPEPPSIEVFDAIFGELRDDFPQKNFATSMQVSINQETGSSVETNEVAGMLLRSADGSRVIQITSDAYVFSYINHYTNWDDFLPEALSRFEIVHRLLGLPNTGHIGTRFINKIEVPHDNFIQGDYFATKISFADGGIQPDEYLIQYVKHHEDVVCNVIQTRNGQGPAQEGQRVEVILDIDTVYTAETNQTQVLNPSSEPWTSLRTAKNSIFATSLTDLAKRSFNA